MSEYRIMRHGRLWCVYISGSRDVLLASVERDNLIAWACELAQDHGGDVDVYGADGRLEMTYSCTTGDEVRQLR